jgi:hypothetical protein
MDLFTRTLSIHDNEHGHIHKGDHFHLSYSVANMGAMTTPNDMITLTFKTPTQAQNTKYTHMIVGARAASGARFRFIEGGTGGGATPTGNLDPKNNNRITAMIQASTLYDVGTPTVDKISYDATLVTGGTTLVDVFLGADGGGPIQAGGSERAQNEWLLNPGTQYQLSLLDTNAVAGTLIMNWYEYNHNA